MSTTLMVTAWTLVVVVLVGGVATSEDLKSQEGLEDVFYAEIRELLHKHAKDEKMQLQESPEPEVHARPPRPREVQGWGSHLTHLGQVSGVSVNTRGQPVIFHRGPRVWDEKTFNDSNFFEHVVDGPITVDTVLTLDPLTGDVVDGWGKDLFYLPHGLTVDSHDDIWLTDVALHQVFKFPGGSASPSLVFGVRFSPGSRRGHLCKPSSVAVATSGEVFIADGYCNSRILKFDGNGELLRIFPQPPEFLSLQVPHSLALIESLDLLCIADRENMRVTCPKAGLGQEEPRRHRTIPPITIQEPDLGRVFAVAARGESIYAVNGPTSRMIPVRGFTIDPKTETIVDHWSPDKGFRNPHDIAFSPDGSTLYVAEIGPNKVWKFDLKRIQK